MSQNLSQTIPAPSGMDVVSDPVLASLARAQLIVNCLFDYPGRLRSNARLVNVLPLPLAHPIDGLAWYYNAVVTNVAPGVPSPNAPNVNLLLFVTNGLLFYSLASADPVNIPFGAPVQVGIQAQFKSYLAFANFFVGQRVRALEFNDETIFVQDGGIQPLRFFASPSHPGPHCYQAGIDAPPAPTTAAGGGTGLTGTYTHKVTYYDERGRESSPSPASTALPVSNKDIVVTIAWNINTGRNSVDRQIKGAYVYRVTDGGSVWYRVANVAITRSANTLLPYTLTAGDYIYNNDANDDAADTTISAGAIAPNPGEYDVPNPASFGVVHKNRLVLNDVTNPNGVQISVANSATQFTSVPAIPVIATDGAQLSVDSDQGDPVTGFASLGTVLLVFKRRAVWILEGDDTTDWLLRSLHKRGGIAPDSVVRCDNFVAFLSDDGVYAGTIEVQKISKEIESWLLMYTPAQREQAVGFFVQNYYFLSIAQTMFAYSLETQGWGVFIFGQGMFQIAPSIPPVLIVPQPFPSIMSPNTGPPPSSIMSPPTAMPPMNPANPNPFDPANPNMSDMPAAPQPANPNTMNPA